MNPASIRKTLTFSNIQKNILFFTSAALLISNIILAAFVISSKEKIIIIPPSITEEFSVSGSDFSDSYIEQMTIFFSDLLLDLTPDNIKYKSEILLKYVDSDSYHSLSEYYKAETEKYKKYKLSTKFDVQNIEITKNGAIIKGVMSSIFEDNYKKQQEACYKIEYKKGAIFQIKSFGKIDEKD